MRKNPGGEPVIKSVDDYIRQFTPEVQRILRKLRKTIKEAAPGAEEKISYRIPAFFHNGVLVYFAAYETHVGFYPTSSGIKAFQAELAEYKGGKGTVRFPIEKPLPYGLIKRIVAHRVAENTKKK
jgi:uncharacterized protein YdhG (YjbR/CyaY superfamily)